jgi:glycosyltransferase involved in cell wall biosynthesis
VINPVPPPAQARPSNPIVYDVLRLFLGIFDPTPRGIDRVDLACARFLFESWPGGCLGVLLTPFGPRLHDRRQVLRWLDQVEAHWAENRDSGDDTELARIMARLCGFDVPRFRHPPAGRQGHLARKSRLLSLLSRLDIRMGKPARRDAPSNALYINVGQLGWAAPWATGWLAGRRDIRPIFMIHDVIPLETPELVSGPGPWAHRRMIKATARHAAAILCTTGATSETVLQAVRNEGRLDIAAEVIPLPVAPVFLRQPTPDPSLDGKNYFVVCGAIEPRKNHMVLLNAWRELIASRGRTAPKLIVAGRPARGGQPIQTVIETDPIFRDSVILATGLSSSALRDLMSRATALLMPSLAEGFGLPIIEALALGTPVLASGLPAHREVGGDYVHYLDPLDTAGWLTEIARLADGGDRVAALRDRIRGYRPMTPAEYNGRLACFLGTFG